MIYRELGRTGYRVSQLGFGVMRLPMTAEGENAGLDRELAIPMLHRVFVAGLNYVDTAVGYCNQDSQHSVGEAQKGWRDRIVLSTKNYGYEDERIWWQHLEDSLERLQVDYIDIYNHHGFQLGALHQPCRAKGEQMDAQGKGSGKERETCNIEKGQVCSPLAVKR